MKVLITGAQGFIGKALCEKMSPKYSLIAADVVDQMEKNIPVCWEIADITDTVAMARICKHHSPDIVIHCAGIAHQKVGKVDASTYMRVNTIASEKLACVASEANPDVHFIFLSSVSVYGEQDLPIPVPEGCRFNPTSNYASSKVEAEKRLYMLYEKGVLQKLSILRLAPVYDRNWSLNLDRRVLAPAGLAFLLFGSGLQRMSALSRQNLVDFISHLLNEYDETDRNINTLRVFNICDKKPYEFKNIIQALRKSGRYTKHPEIHIPLLPVWLTTRLLGMIFSNKKSWWYACYDKLASDLVYDNSRMLKTGFNPKYSLETVFLNEIKTAE